MSPRFVKAETVQRRVEFESALFEKGVFNLPSFDEIPLNVVAETQTGMYTGLYSWLRETADEETFEAVGGLSGAELRTFVEEWGAADVVDLPKSGD